ncbi:MAG: hypothetical protein RLZZ540_3560 [Bacteroidota bacterium]|jgi:hypothetical protein
MNFQEIFHPLGQGKKISFTKESKHQPILNHPFLLFKPKYGIDFLTSLPQ